MVLLMTSFGLEGILERLTQLDDDLIALYGYSRRFELVVVGGSALILSNLAPNSRFTTDIDVLISANELEGLLARYDMNDHVSTFLYRYPENWDERKKKVDFDGQVLEVYTLSNEDLAITKLMAWRAADIADLQNMLKSGNIDQQKLWEILNNPTEVQINVAKEEWESLLMHVSELLDNNES